MKKMKKTKKTLLAILIASTSLLGFAKDTPNILVIMADDLGQGDLSCYGAKAISTPNLDSFAADGIKFNAGYSSSATCTPTRFSFLTGMYAFRQNNTNIAPPNAAAVIKKETVTFPELMQNAGYKTAIIGKWHLGLGERKPEWNGTFSSGPMDVGFDYAFVLPTTNDRVPTMFLENRSIVNLDKSDPILIADSPRPNTPSGITERSKLRLDWSFNHNNTVHNGISRIGWCYGGKSALIRDEDMSVTFVDRAKKWLKENKDEKFFMFFAAINIHVPRMPNEEFQGKSVLGLRGDAILELDWSVGELRNSLEELGLAENTLVVICSDNGAVLDDGYKDRAVELAQKHNHRPSARFNGFKATAFEGGARTPFMSYWKGTIDPQVSDAFISTIDLGKSLCKIAGIEVEDGILPDSLDMSDTLLGKADAKPRDFILIENSEKTCSYQDGTWKVMLHGIPALKGDKKPMTNKMQVGLFNMEEDDVEQNNLLGKEPEILKEMIKKVADIIDVEPTRIENMLKAHIQSMAKNNSKKKSKKKKN